MVSIIIPAYNREILVVETLDSILSQTYTDWEALVVDDQSTDMTRKIVEDYSLKDNRIKLLIRDREPKGAPTCRNIGINNAKGEYIIFLDSDDVLAPFCLEKRVEYMNANTKLDFAVFQMGIITVDGVFIHEKTMKPEPNYLYAFLRHNLSWQTSAPIWKSTFICEFLEGFNDSYPRLQDVEFHTRALLNQKLKFKVLIDSDADFYYRSHTNKVFNVTILLNGFELYLFEFYERIKTIPDFIECRNQLKYCFIAAIKGFYAYNKNNFTNDNLAQLKRINEFAYKQKIISFKTNVYSSILILLYLFRVNKMRYGKYVLRFVMKLIKKS